MPYSTADDLLTGSIPLPDYLSPDKFVEDAADEIDSKIGMRYRTPIPPDNTVEGRPTTLLLKRLNNILASGRLLLTAAAAGEDSRLHAYAESLVAEANVALESIACGDIDLAGAVLVDGRVQDNQPSPVMYNGDSVSRVDSFYNRFDPFGETVPYSGTTTADPSSLIGGKVGPAGPAGASAYQIAVANGFVGTEQQWIDSLNSGVHYNAATVARDPATGAWPARPAGALVVLWMESQLATPLVPPGMIDGDIYFGPNGMTGVTP